MEKTDWEKAWGLACFLLAFFARLHWPRAWHMLGPGLFPKQTAPDSALYFQMWCKTYKRLVYRLQPSRHTNVCKISRLCRAISLLALNYASLSFCKALFPAMSMDTGSLAFILLNKWPTPKRYVSLWMKEPQMSSRPQLQQVRHPLRACWSIGIKFVVLQKRY